MNKKILLALPLAILLMGAGCQQGQETKKTEETPAINAPATTTPVTTQNTGDLKELPAITPTPDLFKDQNTWSKSTTKSGITLNFPTKGLYAPKWTYTLLANDDSHLKGNCYVTDETVYKRENFGGFEKGCQTTTAITDGPGTRIDYFVFSKGSENHMYTFTKEYPAKFDMNAYSATIEQIIKIID